MRKRGSRFDFLNYGIKRVKSNRSGEMWWDYIGWIFLGLLVLLAVATAYAAFSGKLTGWGEWIKNLFAFGR